LGIRLALAENLDSLRALNEEINMTERLDNSVCPRWLHGLAVLTVLCTLPLLFLGAGVTSHGVGVAMSDQQGFRPPWIIINTFLEDTGFALRLEHGHRLFGFLVGLCAIALTVGCWFGDRRPWMGWLALAALTMICVQGLLGIFRVDYNAEYGRTFALIHGVFAQLVVAMLVTIAVLTSRGWTAEIAQAASPTLRRWSSFTALAVFGQLVLGGLVRHREDVLGPRGHLLGAFLVTTAVAGLLLAIRSSEARERFRSQRVLLMGLLALQLVLGMESWLARFHVDGADLPQLAPLPMHAEWIRTMHYLIGTLIFATSVSLVLFASRSSSPRVDYAANVRTAIAAKPMPARELEGVR
jgi:heme A synthase